MQVIDARLVPGTPQMIVRGDFLNTRPIRAYDVTRDGQILVGPLIMSDFQLGRVEYSPTRLHLVQNWFEELKRLGPVD